MGAKETLDTASPPALSHWARRALRDKAREPAYNLRPLRGSASRPATRDFLQNAPKDWPMFVHRFDGRHESDDCLRPLESGGITAVVATASHTRRRPDPLVSRGSQE
jgi:hypothetical protein